MILSFKDEEARRVFRTGRSRRFGVVASSAARRLADIDVAKAVEEWRSPPGNRLVKLKGNRAGQWSIRINDQFRVCFRWVGANAEDVEIVDYH